MDYQSRLKELGFVYNKALGQNFIFDTNLLDAIVEDACIDSTDTVIEIGVGAASLTVSLAKKAGKVIGYELDQRLLDLHTKVLQPFDNTRIIYADFIKLLDSDLQKLGKYKVVANLPYYITTPIIFKLLESCNPPQSTTIMVQKEVADRIVAKPNTKDYGVLTVNVALHTQPKTTRIVPRTAFVPQPTVDSAVVHLKKLDDTTIDKKAVSKLVKCAFASRRKMLANNIQQYYNLSKEQIVQHLNKLAIDPKVRGEDLTVGQFVELASALQT